MDGKKMKALVDEQNDADVEDEGGGEGEEGEEGHSEEHEQAELDVDLSPEAMAERLSNPHVGYMELESGWGAGGCGNCRYMTPDGFCAHPEVQAYVSGDQGCCNEFQGKNAEEIIPQESWEATAKATEASESVE